MSRRQRIISASEVGQFAYCRRAWWLAHIEGCASGNSDALAAGMASHRQHGRTVRLARLGQLIAYTLMAAGILALLGLLAALLVAGAP